LPQKIRAIVTDDDDDDDDDDTINWNDDTANIAKGSYNNGDGECFKQPMMQSNR